jgi:hypothetical protein
MLNFIIAQDYTSNETAECQPTFVFGGGVCDPSKLTASMYLTLYDLRQAASNIYVNRLEAVLAGQVDEETISYTWTGLLQHETLKSFPNQLVENISVIKEKLNVTPELGQLYWSPGLYLAAKDFTDLMMT